MSLLKQLCLAKGPVRMTVPMSRLPQCGVYMVPVYDYLLYMRQPYGVSWGACGLSKPEK